ncbi:MAG: DUF3419 family protein [Rubrimonas sp.]|uniref:DUF3419 family protein n=1 Tax=Rubrimonas sp. TaxID=2036015 RepID=UPI002FDD4058
MDGETIGGRAAAPQAETARNVAQAQQRSAALSKAGLLERLFTRAFSGLVYPQIWEDPALDMEGLQLGPGKRVMTISSGGCNAMSYLTADPEAVTVVDLNAHHVALLKLKIAGAQTLPNYHAFFRFFGEADHRDNPRLYRRWIRDSLDPQTRAYWDARDGLFGRRIDLFASGLYRKGLLGRFIGAGHLAARAFGVRLEEWTELPDQAAQKAWFDATLAPLFDAWLVRKVTGMKASLFGLGIPPAQYDALAGGGDMAAVLRRRLEKLTCDFPVSENYFAWQAFARRYARGDAGPLPPYLQSRWFEAVRARAGRIDVTLGSYTDRLAAEPEPCFDAYLLLDAQDWMTDDQLSALWTQITRTARRGARVVFRTADEPSLLPGRLPDALLDRWTYHAEASADLTARDRAAIYGGVHLYELRA